MACSTSAEGAQIGRRPIILPCAPNNSEGPGNPWAFFVPQGSTDSNLRHQMACSTSAEGAQIGRKPIILPCAPNNSEGSGNPRAFFVVSGPAHWSLQLQKGAANGPRLPLTKI
jgi:hypothetical protein